MSDRTLSESPLKRGQGLDDDSKWTERLGFLYSFSAEKGGRIDPERMRQAVTELERALSSSTSDLDRADILLQLAEACLMLKEFAKGESYAQQAVEMYKDSDRVFAYEFVHKGYVIRGRIALGRGEMVRAKEFLLRSTEVVTSGQGGLSGPYMKLAKELLHQGEKEAVLEYLRRCSEVWTMPNHEFEQWTRVIENGGTPDFGPVHMIH
jgi:tetratricopeptide (TPR) repeat protein